MTFSTGPNPREATEEGIRWMPESETGGWVNSKPRVECQDSQEGETGERLLVVLTGSLPVPDKQPSTNQTQ